MGQDSEAGGGGLAVAIAAGAVAVGWPLLIVVLFLAVAGGTGTGTGTPVAPDKTASSAQVRNWVRQATTIMEKHGVPAGEIDPGAIELIIQHESGGNPDAENRSDINAREGHPSQGLMQTIPSTFSQYALPGHGNILNPVDNIIAGTRYAIAAYGSLDNVPGVVAVEHGGSYVGY